MGIALLLAMLHATLATSGVAPGATSYLLRYDGPPSQVVHVTITPARPVAGPATLVIPRAIPMGYANEPYDRYVAGVRGTTSGGRGLSARRDEGPRWSVGTRGDSVRSIFYDVDIGAMERAITDASAASKLRDGYAGLLGYTVFGYVDGLEDRPVVLRVEGPEGWPVFSTLAPRVPAAVGALAAEAPDFYGLADGQVLMGPDLRVRRAPAAIPLYVAVYAEATVDLDVISRLSAEAMDRAVAYFGGAPMQHYTVVQEYLEPVSPLHEYGFSMEHMESGTFFLGVDRSVTATTGRDVLDRTRFNFIHHFSHSWIPKRAYGRGYFPFTWELAPLIETIWVSEGFIRFATIEMDAERRGGAEGAAYRARTLEGYRAYLAGLPAFLRGMSLIDLSRVGSTQYGSDFRVGKSLFMRGALMAGEMDARIRSRTQGRKGMRDALRGLISWTRAHPRGFEVAELPGIIREATGVDVSDIYARWLTPPAEGG